MFPIISIQTKDQKVISEFRSSYVPKIKEWLWIGESTDYWTVDCVVTHLLPGGGFKIIIIVK